MILVQTDVKLYIKLHLTDTKSKTGNKKIAHRYGESYELKILNYILHPSCRNAYNTEIYLFALYVSTDKLCK